MPELGVAHIPLTCKSCQKQFMFTREKQLLFVQLAAHGLTMVPPKWCPRCRRSKARARGETRGLLARRCGTCGASFLVESTSAEKLCSKHRTEATG